jgi:adenine phosphoribosyltransferase
MKPAPPIDLRAFIRDVPDFPKKGILFKDISPLLADHHAFRAAVEAMAEPFLDRGVEAVAGIESRGFVFAAAIGLRLGAGVVLVRKKGKLPCKTLSVTYGLEYGSDTLEIHQDALRPGERVLLVDDVLATGGTARASCDLLEKLGASVEGACFLIELGFLNGREKLSGRKVCAPVLF